MNRTFAVLDMRSREIAAVAAEWGKNGDCVFKEFLVCPSKGIPHGVVKDMARAADSIADVVSKLSEKTGKKIHEVHVTVSSPCVELMPSQGTILLSKYGREILPRDVEKCVRVGSVIKSPTGKEFLHRMVREFSIDSAKRIKNPVGLEGLKMGVTMSVIVMGVSVVRNLKKCVTLAGYSTGGIIFSGIACSYRTLPGDSGDEGTCFVNIRGDMTEVVIFCHGSPVDCRVLYFDAVKNDFSSGKGDTGGTRELIEILTSMSGWNGAKTIIVSGECEISEEIAEGLRLATGRSVRHGTCSSMPLEYLPTDRMRYIGCLGVLDHLRAANRLKRGEVNPFKWFFDRIIGFMDEYF
ncbi:MAG: hypothetical protein KJ995_02200 [Candidatus Omnitrophica bacterium]|nr:hypothetical protein [Candidatus Omnitrophota bacterium]MBU1128805.1 hypothetical protein [Candidatus Omnitrophota bacterium]MBU1785141.1 hypothetical protein [Candidatus Omnitrophota bacterium]MBU1851202.1 hypothetical protein [Candidatus Omnitrophota bacterium]